MRSAVCVGKHRSAVHPPARSPAPPVGGPKPPTATTGGSIEPTHPPALVRPRACIAPTASSQPKHTHPLPPPGLKEHMDCSQKASPPGANCIPFRRLGNGFCTPCEVALTPSPPPPHTSRSLLRSTVWLACWLRDGSPKGGADSASPGRGVAAAGARQGSIVATPSSKHDRKPPVSSPPLKEAPTNPSVKPVPISFVSSRTRPPTHQAASRRTYDVRPARSVCTASLVTRSPRGG